ncbi:putative phosphatidate phosphatase isoform X2 [Atheta coriaria]|uniref:putative phosphatidate phosphatase isoform X2 n=1 Tax=Dalotia coriaria TaxID=877792 RepID=UPI0031F403C8
MAEENRKSLPALIIELLIIIAGGLVVLSFFLWGKAFHRGFYCDDESLRHPYHDSTVPSYYLYIFGFGGNLIAIIISEFKGDRKARVTVAGFSIPKWIFESYREFIFFCFGAACSQCITDSLKYTVGRLRPHFYTLCLPIFQGTTCESNISSLHRYITDYQCSNPDISQRQLKEMRLSFPSGHSSFAMYTMLYFALFVGARFKCRTWSIIKHSIQYIAVLGALWVGMTRVSDYKHHWSDVLAGLAIGVVSAVINGVYVAKLLHTDKSHSGKQEPNQNGGTNSV